ncbi:hypothetical protein J7M22_07480 [Candidatus Poribacteria bacterium]|nr:hypothetical protein [Candidatus Poribacteria bacterium]
MSSIPESDLRLRSLLEAEVSKRVYAAKLTKLTRRVDRLENSAIKRLLSLLQELQREIRRELSETPEERFRAEHLRTILSIVNDRIADYSARLERAMNEELEEFYHQGSNDFDEMLEVQGIKAPMFGLPRDVLEIAQGFSADLISNITDDLRNRINRVLRLGILRGDPPFKIMREIGARIDRGVFRTPMQRAEAVARTELLRMYSLGHWARMQSTAEYVPGLKKRWVSAHDPRVRPSHARADGQIVPWDKPFLVGGHKAMYPRDPRLPPEESVNCRCVMVPVITEEELRRIAPTTMVTPEVRKEVVEPSAFEKLGVSERAFKRNGEAEAFTEGSALEGFRMQLLRKEDPEGEFIEANFKISREHYSRICNELRKTSFTKLEERGIHLGTMRFEPFQRKGGRYVRADGEDLFSVPSFVRETDYYRLEIPIGEPLEFEGERFFSAGSRALDGFVRLRVRGGLRDAERALKEVAKEFNLPDLLKAPTRRDLEKAKMLKLLWQEDPEGWRKLKGYHPSKVSMKRLKEHFDRSPELREKLSRMELMDLKGYRTFILKGREAELREKGAIAISHELSNPEDVVSIIQNDFLSTFERLKRGLPMTGKSPKADLRSGGADHVFFRIITSGTSDRRGKPRYSVFLVYDLKPLERTDWWIYPSDKFGTTREELFFKRASVTKTIEILNRNWWPGNEIMIRNRVPASQLRFILVRKGGRKRMEELLKDAGIKRVGSRPISQVIREFESWEDFKEAFR